MKDNSRPGPLFWIPVILNGLTLFISLVVGITFLIGSQMPATAEVHLPDIILYFFTLFDLLLMISPLTLIVMVLLSVFNVMKANSKFQRFFPLTFSTIMQGMLTALLLSSITQPVA